MIDRVNHQLVLKERAEARALLFKHAVYETIGDAVDPLFAYAYDIGLIDRLGTKAVANVIELAFRKYGLNDESEENATE